MLGALDCSSETFSDMCNGHVAFVHVARALVRPQPATCSGQTSMSDSACRCVAFLATEVISAAAISGHSTIFVTRMVAA